jgi:hypothetical protein
MELPIFNTHVNFSRHHFCCFIIVPLFVSDKSMAWNRCLQHPCFKKLCKIAQASKNSDSNAQYFLSDLPTHSWFHSMLFALAGYQFPHIVMNRCLYLTLWINSSSTDNREQCTCSFLDLTNRIWYKTKKIGYVLHKLVHMYAGNHITLIMRKYATKPNEKLYTNTQFCSSCLKYL